MKLTETNARNQKEKLPDSLKTENISMYLPLSVKDGTFLCILGEKSSPALKAILNDPLLSSYFLFLEKNRTYYLSEHGAVLKDDSGNEISMPDEVKASVASYLDFYQNYGGRLDEEGEQIIDLKMDNVGPHYDVNLLLGDRKHFDHPLQSTPKSVINRFFQGSFRSHSAYQVLATTWGIRPEENGFAANRQFYLSENGKQIFYSAKITDNIKEATCTHKVNHSTITYLLNDGLEIRRTIFILPQKEGLPLATEIQTIDIINHSHKERHLDLVYTGMFGFSNPHCQEEDVIYSTLVSQSQILQNEKGEIIALTPDYYPEYFKREMRFVILKDEDSFIDSFQCDYTSFIGKGSLEEPERLGFLDNTLMRKGPNFFALKKHIDLRPEGIRKIDTFTGMVDGKGTEGNGHNELLKEQLSSLLETYGTREELDQALKTIQTDFRNYSSFLQIESEKESRRTSYINSALPFQVLYQTFVSRSFAMTQKGYREIGFREIQDLYASMYYLYQEGEQDLIKSLLKQWIENVYSFGYSNHNFFYVGKEPGQCSDDSLWLIFAVYHYLCLTEDDSFLDEKFQMAGTDKKRTLYETLLAIINYSGRISVGKHGLPLLDLADWNDCLKIDPDVRTGPEKEKDYLLQLRKNHQKKGAPLETDRSESVMNGFLLVIAIQDIISFAKKRKDQETVDSLTALKKEKEKSLNQHAFINGYYARVLLNRKVAPNTYIGSRGDGLSIDREIDGSYYLNSFSWSLLSDVADEKKIKEMLPVIDRYLKCPAGYKLCTMHDLSKAGAKSSSTDHYYVGDRENGGVFKHAGMMFSRALLYKAKNIQDENLKKQMVEDAFFMIDRVYPFRTFENVDTYKGNPRFCTQYNNSITMENVGPILSGTATWLTLCILEALGIEIKDGRIHFSPMLREETENVSYQLKYRTSVLDIRIHKKKGSLCDSKKMTLIIDGKRQSSTYFKPKEGQRHEVEINFQEN